MGLPFGSTTGPFYPLGKIVVTNPGTPTPLSTTPSEGQVVQAGAGTASVASTTGFGTPTTGVPGLTLAGLPAQLVCMGLLITTPAGNTGLVYLCFLGSGAQPGGRAVPNSIVLGLPPGSFFPLLITNLQNPFMPGMFGLDADTLNNSAYVTAVIS